MSLPRFAPERHAGRGWCVIDREAGGMKVAPDGHYWDSKRPATLATDELNRNGGDMPRGIPGSGPHGDAALAGRRPDPPRSNGHKARPAAPVFALVKAEPPDPPRKRTVADEVRPLLAEIVDTEWYRVAVYPTRSGAAIAKRRLVDEIGTDEWEWRSGAANDDEDKSGIYVRRLSV